MNNSMSAIENAVGNCVVEGNTQYFADAQSAGQTVFGSLAQFLETNQAFIDDLGEKAGNTLATNRAAKITKRFEEKSTWWERHIKNDPIKVAKMERNRSFQTSLFSILGQLLVQGGAYVAKEGLAMQNDQTIRKYLWVQCGKFADSITGGRPQNYPQVLRRMQILGDQIGVQITAENIVQAKDIRLPRVNVSSQQSRMLAIALFEILAGKYGSDIDEIERAFGTFGNEKFQLLTIWNAIGLQGSAADSLYNECYRKMRSGDNSFVAINYLMQCYYSNLVFSIPKINMDIAQRVNEEFLEYVPNSITQHRTRVVGHFLKGTAITGGYIAGAVILKDPALAVAAAAEALSMFNLDAPGLPEAAGKCLMKSGLSSEQAVAAVKNNLSGHTMRKSIQMN